MSERLCTSNPVHSNALDASFSNPWMNDHAIISSVCFGSEYSLVWGGGAIVGKVHIARCSMEIQLVPHGGGCYRGPKKMGRHVNYINLKDQSKLILQFQINTKCTYILQQAPLLRSGLCCLRGSHGCILRWKQLQKTQTVHSECHHQMGRSQWYMCRSSDFLVWADTGEDSLHC